MMSVQVFGARIRQARIFRRQSGTAVMEHMGWRSPRQTRLEKSETATLDGRELDALAAFLRFPATFFTNRPLSRVTGRDLLFRAPKPMPAGERDYLAVLANLIGDLAVDLDARHQLPPVGVEPLPVDVAIVDAAAVTRDWLGVPPLAPITDLIAVVESAGVPVIVRPPTGVDDGAAPQRRHLGCSARAGANRERPVMLVGAAVDSWEHTRWVVAHEIGHLVLHRYGDITAREEHAASRFAAELLAPAQALSTELPVAPTLSDLVQAKLRWRVSLAVLIEHLRQSQLVDAERADSLMRQLQSRINPDTGHTWGKTEPGWNAYAAEQPRMVQRAVETWYSAYELSYPSDLLTAIGAGRRAAR